MEQTQVGRENMVAGGSTASTAAVAEGKDLSGPSGWFSRAGRQDISSILTFGLLALIVFIAVFAPLLAPSDPYDLAKVSIIDSRLPPGAQSGTEDLTFWLGTDGAGRDLLSAILYGLRISLYVAVTSTIFAMAIGVSVGVTAAYCGGRIDTYAMRVVDLQLSFPTMLVALVILTVLGRGINNIIISIVIVQWAYFARTARASALVESSKEYIEAARCLRIGHMRIIFRHLLPNSLPPLIVIGTIQTAHAVTLEATLSFLGLGLPSSEPSLGLLISNGFQYIHSFKWWITFFPGIVLFVTVVCINLAGDQVRTFLNPRNR